MLASILRRMQQGDVVADRFVIEALIAAGGMGQIFRARDRENGDLVAVKALIGDLGAEDVRFGHEARALAELKHPCIVRYVAHGVAASGESYLAMEWLDGEDLSRRLGRAKFTIEESVLLARNVADALGMAHARGIVHRDLKPSNIFLVGQGVDQVKIVDFGIARLGGATRVTRTGMIVGTPGYMAPEQVQNDRPIDSRADVFSLGCVLFECLTGSPAFAGEHLMALLAKVLFAEPARLRELRPDAPEALEQLLLRMMAKDPDERPQDGASVVVELAALDRYVGTSSVAPPKVALTSSERRTISVVLVEADRERPNADNATPAKADTDAAIVLRTGAEAFGGRLEHLRDGSVAVSIGGAGLPTDQAAQAARCALWLRENAGGRAVALATGRGEVTGKNPAAEAIDRAAKLLFSRVTPGDCSTPAVIAIDEVTARLLDGQFDVRESGIGYALHGEQKLGEGTRTLLGKATPCVGRDAELRLLQQLFEECVEEPGARVMVVTAPPGTGKSRLLQEFLRAIHARGETVSVWMSRGDPLRAGSAFGLLSQMLRGACGLRDGDPLEVRREKLEAHIATRVEPSHRQRINEFLGEIVGAPCPGEGSLPLRSARKDAQLMNEQMRGAFLDLLRAECERNPVILVLEDLHWGDRPTVQFVDHALRDLREWPLFVLTMARPEVQELFPKLWSDRSRQELLLKPLGKRASERLARHVLGSSLDNDVIDRLVKLSEGNAFYLEELIRATAEGSGADLPETVVAMVQSRLGALGDGARRILRAASVFGEVFWGGSIACLLGEVDSAMSVRARIDDLSNRELVVKRKESRFPDEDEYAFRHALLREGAYGMLTDEDRVLGHRLAGEWLEQHGEQDALALAEHFEQGDEGTRAGLHYLRAAEQASWGGDSAAVIARAKRGLACRLPDELRIQLLGTLCELHYSNMDFLHDGIPYADELLRVAEQGSGPWSQGMLVKLLYSIRGGNLDEFMNLLTTLRATTPALGAVKSWAHCFAIGIYLLDLLGGCRKSDEFVADLATVARVSTDREPLAAVPLHATLSVRAAYAQEDPSKGIEHGKECLQVSANIGHRRYTEAAKVFIGMNLWCLGAFEGDKLEIMATNLRDEEIGMASSYRPFVLAWTLADRGAFDEARQWASRLVDSGRARRFPLNEGRGHWALGEVLRRAGDFDAADAEIQAAFELLRKASPLDVPGVLGSLAALRLAQGRPTEALAVVEDAFGRYDSMGACGFFRGAFLRVVRAECLAAAGHHNAAHEAIAIARERLHTIAAKVSDPEYRKSFLENVPENRRTLDLAQTWLGDRTVMGCA